MIFQKINRDGLDETHVYLEGIKELLYLRVSPEVLHDFYYEQTKHPILFWYVNVGTARSYKYNQYYYFVIAPLYPLVAVLLFMDILWCQLARYCLRKGWLKGVDVEKPIGWFWVKHLFKK